MDIEWRISADDVRRIRALVRLQADTPLVRERLTVNRADVKPQVRRKRFWHQMVGMRLTSVQRAGEGSPVARFIETSPFPLSYEATRTAGNVEAFIATTVEQTPGIRHYNVIGRQLAANFRLLEGGE